MLVYHAKIQIRVTVQLKGNSKIYPIFLCIQMLAYKIKLSNNCLFLPKLYQF